MERTALGVPGTKQTWLKRQATLALWGHQMATADGGGTQLAPQWLATFCRRSFNRIDFGIAMTWPTTERFLSRGTEFARNTMLAGLLPKERIQCSLRRVRGPWARHHARCRRSCRSGCKRGWPSSRMRRGKLVKPFRCWKGVDACSEATTSTTYSNWMQLIQYTSDFLLYPFPAGFSLSSNLPFPSRYPFAPSVCP